MSITVRELAGLPHLRCVWLAGESGMDHEITWAHSSDLEEPWAWLLGGEMLMKNGRTMPRSASAQVNFVEGLHGAGVSALVIGVDPRSVPLSLRARERADTLGLPILEVPYTMNFSVLSRTVADALTNRQATSLARAERLYDAIRSAVANDDPSAFVAKLRTEVGGEVHVIDGETLNPVLVGTRPLSPMLRELLTSHFQQDSPGLARMSLARGGEVVVVEVPYHVATWLVAVYPSRRDHDPVVLHHAAVATAVGVAHVSLRAEHARQVGGELLGDLMDSRLETAVGTRRLAEFELASSESLFFAVRGTTPVDERRLHLQLHRRSLAHLMVRRGDVIFVLLKDDGGDVVGIIERLAHQYSVGIARPVEHLARIPEAMREALWALAGAGENRQIVHYGATAPLPGLASVDEGHELVERVLGPLITYDAVNDSELVVSLETFLNERRSWQRCATVLNVHRQTVIYRMRRVEELTTRSLGETGDLAMFWLALNARRILRGETPL